MCFIGTSLFVGISYSQIVKINSPVVFTVTQPFILPPLYFQAHFIVLKVFSTSSYSIILTLSLKSEVKASAASLFSNTIPLLVTYPSELTSNVSSLLSLFTLPTKHSSG